MQTLLKQSIIGGLSFLLLTGIAFSVGSSEPSVFEGEAQIIYTEDVSARIDFEDLTAVNMNSGAFNQSYYSGRLVADGVPTSTAAPKIDNITLGMRISSAQLSKKLTIQTTGYAKIIFDLKQSAITTSVTFGCDDPVVSNPASTIVRDIEILTRDYGEVIITFSAPALAGSNRDFGIDNIRFYTAS
jgi:hypothetical protein